MFIGRMHCRTPVRVHLHHSYSTYSTPTPTQLSALRTWSNNITSIHRHTHDHISPSKVLDLLCTLPTRSPLIAPAYRAYQLGTHSSPFTSAYEMHDALSKLFRKGAPLLPTHSLAFFHAHAPEEMLGMDRTEMDFNPPEESGFVRRMWAGGKFTWGKERNALLVGQDACASARVAKVETKGFKLSSTATTTTAPPMLFVHQDIEYRHSDDPKVLFTEERVHVYLPVSKGKPRQTARTVSGIPITSDFTFTWTPSQTALFRFSALMFNAHLIHLDRGHTRSEEGLPDLVVHGPLTAIMLVENYLVSDKGSKLPISFEYRARNPVLVDKRQHLKGKFDNTGKKALVWVEDDDGIVGMTGTLEF